MDNCRTSFNTGLANSMAAASPRIAVAVPQPKAATLRTFVLYVGSAAAATFLFWSPVHDVLQYSATCESSYIPLVPLISAFLLAFRRRKIFDAVVPNVRGGGIVIAASLAVFLATHSTLAGSPAQLSLTMASLVGTWLGLFIAYFGCQTAKKAAIPLALLAFAVPWPAEAMNSIIRFLQHGSAVLSYYLFRAIGVPAVRENMTISLPALTIEVAPQCSGIRSSISLLILTLAGANLYVRSSLSKFVLVAAVIPLVLIKNAIRIVTLSTLALYVDRGFLTGHLHHDGGIVFFMVALLMLMPVLLIIQKLERKSAANSGLPACRPELSTIAKPIRT